MEYLYYIVYKTTNTVNNMWYIGQHKTNNLEDGYLGSGTDLKAALEKISLIEKFFIYLIMKPIWITKKKN